MELIERKYILPLTLIFKSVYGVISATFLKFTSLLGCFVSINDNNDSVLSNSTIVYSFKQDKFLKEGLPRSNKVLNTATVYINGSNHNLVYAASACRLHPGPALYTRHVFWRTTAGR